MGIGGLVSRISAVVLLLGGVALLFAPDSILPLAAPGVPASAAWLGGVIGAGWLAVAALNWLSRGAVLGGIYGRPVVAANVALYFITSMVLLRAAGDAGFRSPLWLAAAPMLALAGAYGWLLVRGPLGRDARSAAPAPESPCPAEPPTVDRMNRTTETGAS